jgi:polyisoprenoid-binding protein YceI
MPRSRLPLILALAVVAVALASLVVYGQFLAGDDVARLSLPPATAAPTAVDPSDGSGSSEGPGSGTATAADLAGTWVVSDGSVVGYRVREQLGGVSALSDAVGRTSAVTGTATIEARGEAVRVAAAEFEADLGQLASDDGRRDRRIRTIGLETNEFPTAAFVLAEAIDVPADALAGATVDVTFVGDLALHGVTKRVAIPGQARLSGDRIEVVGALTFPFSDFGMTPPNIAGFVRVEDDATLELQLSLARA